jgi:hypothetical protein
MMIPWAEDKTLPPQGHSGGGDSRNPKIQALVFKPKIMDSQGLGGL